MTTTPTTPPPPHPSPRAPRSLVAVDGIDGSGKSVLARRLAAAADQAGVKAIVVGVDDFRRPVDWRRGDRPEHATYYEDYYDLALADRAVAAFLAGAADFTIPVFDSAAETIVGSRSLPFGEATVAVVEGVFVRRVPAIAAGAALVYLRTSFAEARRRIVARDTARGRTLADVSHRIEQRYFPAQERYLREHDPAAHADVLIENEDVAVPTVVRFARHRFAPRVADALTQFFRDFASAGEVG